MRNAGGASLTRSPQPKQEEIGWPQFPQTNRELTPVKPGRQGVPTSLEKIMEQQLQVMSKQLEILQGLVDYTTNPISVSDNGQPLSADSPERITQKQQKS